MDGSRQQAWGEILSLTRQMEERLTDSEWETMGEIASRRQKLIEAFFSQGISEEESAEIADEIRALQSLDKQLIETLKVSHKGLVGDIKGVQRGRHAAAQYQKHS